MSYVEPSVWFVSSPQPHHFSPTYSELAACMFVFPLLDEYLASHLAFTCCRCDLVKFITMCLVTLVRQQHRSHIV